MDGLSDLQQVIQQLIDPMGMMQRVVDQAVALLDHADGAVVEMLDGDHLTYACAGGSLASFTGTRLHQDESLSGMAVSKNETLLCSDSETDQRVDRDACRHVGARSMICVPLGRAAGRIGALKVTSSRPAAFTASDVDSLNRLAEFITTAIAGTTEIANVTTRLLSLATSTGMPDSLGPRNQEFNDGASAGLEKESTPALGTNPEVDQGLAAVSSADDDLISQFVANVLMPGITGNVNRRRRVEHVLRGAKFKVVCQPIVDLVTDELVGVEALSRFEGPPDQPPDIWFAEAHDVGLGVSLELAATRMALGLLEHLPEDCYLACNVGPKVLASKEIGELLEGVDPNRIVLELTEHVVVDDYPRLRDVLVDIREKGVRLAIDDTGSGFASLAHILELAPDIIKLDRDLTTGIDTDPVRKALAGALVSFSTDMGSRVVAEGIETSSELDTLRSQGIRYGQGYLLGRPGPVDELPTDFSQNRVSQLAPAG